MRLAIIPPPRSRAHYACSESYGGPSLRCVWRVWCHCTHHPSTTVLIRVVRRVEQRQVLMHTSVLSNLDRMRRTPSTRRTSVHPPSSFSFIFVSNVRYPLFVVTSLSCSTRIRRLSKPTQSSLQSPSHRPSEPLSHTTSTTAAHMHHTACVSKRRLYDLGG
ncbi:hypothetical protein BDQ17DRAFT_238441 [Cyathus striatus]|nr:hypothetical protein BDQ17DRAFT_238441 [Cyathus striatus]